ncbi:MAG TPA: WecB/TagA/CpsF family glycosyltransferase [Oscillatoriaceae cyanobacterium]
MPTTLERLFVLDLPVDLLTRDEALGRVAEAIAQRQALRVVTLNAEMAMQAQADAELAGIIRDTGLVVPDGSGVVWALRRQGRAVAKLPGIELLETIAAAAAKHGWRVYFLGGKPGVADKAVETLCARYPGLCVAGARDGYFNADDEQAVIETVRAAQTDILLVALGVPRQEKWIARHQSALGVSVAMGVGGSFDVFAGTVKRAPAVFQKLHLEWLFRLMQEPWRFQRMQSTLPRFVSEVLTRGERQPGGPT